MWVSINDSEIKNCILSVETETLFQGMKFNYFSVRHSNRRDTRIYYPEIQVFMQSADRTFIFFAGHAVQRGVLRVKDLV